MIESLADLLESLFSSDVGGGRAIGYYLLAGLVAILGMVAAARRARAWRGFKDKQRASLRSKTLTATAVSTEKRGDVDYVATISPDANGYRLVVTKGTYPDTSVAIDQTASSLENMEKLLRDKTQFVLADFS